MADWIDTFPNVGWWADPESVVADRRSVEQLRRVLREAVSDQDREILVRTALDGEPVGRVAASMGLSVGAVRKRLTRLRAKLRTHLNHDD